MPQSVSDLLAMGVCRVLIFVESLLPLNVRKEVENCRSAAFQFWAIPKIKKTLGQKNQSVWFWRNFTEGN